MTDSIAPYRALALQLRCHAVNGMGRDEARASINAAIERTARGIDGSRRFIGNDLALVVLPEYFLTGFPFGESVAEWRDVAAIEMDGPEYAALGKIAMHESVFLAGNAYEIDPNFAELYFQTSFVIDPSGDIVLRYRRLISMFAPTPHDVWDRYLELYGLDGVFPVASTAIGRLGAVASEEILYPEVTRAMALRGAEIIVHSTSESGSPELTPKDVAKRARAFENSVYVVSANSAGIRGNTIPDESTDGMSKVVDFEGRVLAAAGYAESMVANAAIDIAALRHHRRRPGMSNMLSRQRTELYGVVADGRSVYPSNTLLDSDGASPAPDKRHFIDAQLGAIRKLADDGII